jgi:ATP-dependent helicase/nuclease subunit A
MYIYNPSNDTQTIEDNPTCNDTIFEVDEPLKEDIISNCNFKYVNEKADLPARISVSTIIQSSNDDTQIKSTILGINLDTNTDDLEENLNSDLRTPNFMNSESLTPAEKGTAIHKVMQYCNFENLSKDINEELRRLLLEGYITNEQFKVIDTRVFKRLIHSDIFELIKRNKVQRERDFLIKVSELDLQNEALNVYKDTDTMLQGCLDMVVFEPDGITIIDYKTDNVYTMETLKERYALQVQLYRSALSLIENLPVKRTLIYSMKLGKSIEID